MSEIVLKVVNVLEFYNGVLNEKHLFVGTSANEAAEAKFLELCRKFGLPDDEQCAALEDGYAEVGGKEVYILHPDIHLTPA